MKPEIKENLVWKITGRVGHVDGKPPDNWRDLLATRLGQRPRRIGMLAELALYGALDCLDAADEAILPKDAVLRVCSMHGASAVISQVLEQNQTELPMPFSFLQSQSSQLLPALATALKWQGDAAIVMARDRMSLALLAARQAGPNGMLLGWVEESPCSSQWLRLARCAIRPENFTAAKSFGEMISSDVGYWRLGEAGIEISLAQDCKTN